MMFQDFYWSPRVSQKKTLVPMFFEILWKFLRIANFSRDVFKTLSNIGGGVKHWWWCFFAKVVDETSVVY